MTQISLSVLLGLVAWTLCLLILMEALRGVLILRGKVAPNKLTPDNAGLSPFMQRLARAHANCVESLPVFGLVLVVAIVTDRTAITDPGAPWLLGARLVQSAIHLSSLSNLAVTLRFIAFAVQVALAVYWTYALLAG